MDRAGMDSDGRIDDRAGEDLRRRRNASRGAAELSLTCLPRKLRSVSEEKMAAPGFWIDPRRRANLLKNLRLLKGLINRHRDVHQHWEDLGS